MQAVFATNFKCNVCVNKARVLLDQKDVIDRWETDLDDPRKLLRVETVNGVKALDISHRLAELGFKATPVLDVIQDRPLSTAEVSEPKAGFRFSTYKPLLLVVAYITAATFFVESIHGEFEWHRAMSYFMGFFFLGFAFFKLLNVEGFADAFSTYDILAKRSRLYALAYPWIEVALGVLFLTQSALFAANVATLVIMTLGLVGVVAAVRRKQAIQCACLGTVFNLPMSVVTIVENSVMIAMAAIMILS